VWHSEQRLRLLLEAVTDYAIFLLDPDGRVVSWNQGAERIKGWRREEILGEHLSRFYLPEEVAAGKPARELHVAAREGRVEDEGWRLRKDGSRFWADVVITAVHDEAGVLHGFAKVTRDLSERRLLEAQQRQPALVVERSGSPRGCSRRSYRRCSQSAGFAGGHLHRRRGPAGQGRRCGPGPG
jgi:PAS domain S-box-containing protein